MATVSLRYSFADGDAITASVQVEASYPDAIDEARTEAVRAFREGLGAALEATLPDDDD